MADDLSYILPELRHLAVPVDEFKPLPHNPRKGDVKTVANSIRQFGQRRAITFVRDGDDKIITAGNTTWQAMKKLGYSHIAAIDTGDDEETAAAWAIADNRTHDVGTYDNEALAIMLEKVRDPALIIASGYNESEIREIMDSVRVDRDAMREMMNDGGGGNTGASAASVVSYNIIFDDTDQQQTWYRFVRWLKNTVDGETLAERLANFLEEMLPDEEE